MKSALKGYDRAPASQIGDGWGSPDHIRYCSYPLLGGLSRHVAFRCHGCHSRGLCPPHLHPYALTSPLYSATRYPKPRFASIARLRDVASCVPELFVRLEVFAPMSLYTSDSLHLYRLAALLRTSLSATVDPRKRCTCHVIACPRGPGRLCHR